MNTIKTVDIPGYDGLYTINSLGNIYGKVRDDYILARKLPYGYTVRLCKNGVHKTLKLSDLMVRSFINDSKDCIGHRDGNPYNLSLDNLIVGKRVFKTVKAQLKEAIAQIKEQQLIIEELNNKIKILNDKLDLKDKYAQSLLASTIVLKRKLDANECALKVAQLNNNYQRQLIGE